MYSTQLSRQSSVNSNDPMFKENIILTDRHRAFSLLLHSVTVQANTISGYSHKFDSLITFPFSEQDYKVLQNKLDKLPPNTQDCNSCHKYAGY